MRPAIYTLDDFHYHLPKDLIAQRPHQDKSKDRLLVYEKGTIKDHFFDQLGRLLPPETLLIINDTKVFPSRLKGQFTNGKKGEIFLLAPSADNPSHWQALGKPLKKISIGERFTSRDLSLKIIDLDPQSSPPTLRVEVESHSQEEFQVWLGHYGYVPLPPYIKREQEEAALTSEDRLSYQTIFASENGSVAAPTAGLHFTPEGVQSLEQAGIQVKPITLHVGAGTFLPVKSHNLREHQMHKEPYLVPLDTFQALKKQKELNKPIYCVGTTSFRCLESFQALACQKPDQFYSTDLFIYPRNEHDHYHPLSCDGLVTNFHQPGSTLFMLIAALIGLPHAKAFYSHAIAKSYRFLSYGDACLFHLPVSPR